MYYRFVNGRRVAVDLDDIQSGAAFLVGGSPSLESVDLGLLQRPGIVSAAMNNVAAFFRPTYWIGADSAGKYSKSILMDPSFMKFCYLSKENDVIGDKMWQDMPNTIFLSTSECKPSRFFYKSRDFIWWRNVFLLALQVLYRLGFRTVYCVGCSFFIDDKPYFYETGLSDNEIEYNKRTYTMVLGQLTNILPFAKDTGFKIISCTKNSKLNDIVEHMAFEHAIDITSATLPAHDTVNVDHPLDDKLAEQNT